MPQLGKILIGRYASAPIAQLTDIYLWEEHFASSYLATKTKIKDKEIRKFRGIREFSAFSNIKSPKFFIFRFSRKTSFAQNDGYRPGWCG